MGLLGLTFLYPNVFVMPDLYGNTPGLPGRRDWEDAAKSFLTSRMLFASGHPIRSVQESIAGLMEWNLPDDPESDPQREYGSAPRMMPSPAAPMVTGAHLAMF